MSAIKPVIRKESKAGDAAVHGLFNGVLAGGAMIAHLILAGLVLGEGPGTVLSRFNMNSDASPIVGAFLHLAVAGVYGMLFGLLRHLAFLRRPLERFPGWLFGLTYGLVLYIIAEAILLPGASPLREIAAIHFLVAHLLYGLVLGLLNT